MNFDMDDPLGDLLSDGSNDSFFGDTPKKSTPDKKTETVVKSTGSASKVSGKSKMDELFGIQPAEKPTDIFGVSKSVGVVKGDSKTDTSGPSSLGTPRVPSTPQMKHVDTATKIQSSGPSSLKKSFEKDDDIFADLGFDPKVKPTKTSKTSILDDLLGVSEPIKPIIRPKTGGTGGPLAAKEDFGGRPKTSTTTPSKQEETVTTKPTPVSRQSTNIPDASNPSETSVLSGYTPSTRRSGRRGSSLYLNDPLGLFTKPEENAPKSDEIKSATQSTAQTVTQPLVPSNQPVPAPRPDQTPAAQLPQANFIQSSSITPAMVLDNKAQMLAISATETEHAISALKQQELQLVVASNMKSQEAALLDMQRRQENLLRQQETQFNDLLQKQLQRQTLLERSIKEQQERITAHIQLLMTQPAAAFTGISNASDHKISKLKMQDSNDETSVSEDEHKTDIDLKAEIKQLELEKLRLEDLLSNINANHENEIIYMENSHKKQIKLLEENLQKTEERLRSENKSLQDYYFNKIGDLENEKQHILEESKLKLKSLQEEYDKGLKDAKKKYEEDLETMERNHKEMIQNIRESKLLEFSIVQENGSYLETLKNASKMLENANQDFGTLKNELQEKIDKVYHEKESELRIREMKVQQSEELMQKEKKNCEEERIRLMELVKTLEIKLNSLEQTASEENWNMKQKAVSLDVDKAAFEREKTFIREQLTREQKRLEELKQLQSLEYDRMMKQIEEERMNLVTEKAKIETNLRLQKRTEPNTSRAEIEAALKIAEEAGRQADIERERLLDVQKQYEAKRRELSAQERDLKTKEITFEEAISATKAKEKLAETAHKNAKILERNMLIKLQLLQKHSKELKERESKLSIEKLNLSKERMQLETQRRKMLDSRCSLCKLGAKTMEISNVLTGSEANNSANEINEFDLFKDEVDNELDASLNVLRKERQAAVSMGEEIEIDLNAIPDIIDMSDNLLDDDLLLLKFDILNSTPRGNFQSPLV